MGYGEGEEVAHTEGGGRNWGFLLPKASAVLTVLWPDFFTVYDGRVCDQLGDYRRLANWTRFDRIWECYEQFRAAVLAASAACQSLRDADRYLWRKSTAVQLRADIARRFIA